MAYSIYGTPLRRGYCEVHPDVAEEYPCYRCMEEAHEAELSAQYQAYCEEQAAEYYASLEADRIAELDKMPDNS